jgi:hypothetical protein
MEHADVFVLIAELAIAFAGFASVVVVFRARQQEAWSGFEQAAFGGMLRNSLAGDSSRFCPSRSRRSASPRRSSGPLAAHSWPSTWPDPDTSLLGPCDVFPR